MHCSIRPGRVADIEIGLHYIWLFAVILVARSLAVGYFPSVVPGVDVGTFWLGVGAALLLSASCYRTGSATRWRSAEA
jgi:hypothetical protein